MPRRTPWIERKFAVTASLTMFPNVLERLRGTPARLEDRVSGLTPERLRHHDGEGWSIQETVGHLIQVEPLWLGRIDDFSHGLERLRPADMSNKNTYDADYNSENISKLLAEFRRVRGQLVTQLEAMSEANLTHEAIHPRLNQPMRVLDLMIFAAEHDDHHLVTITDRLRRVGGLPMEENADLMPVLQLEDLDALKAAREHLAQNGYRTQVGPFAELPEAEWQDWMTPSNGGYLLYLERAHYAPAMDMLGKFFGCAG